jgi:hypothetical protein
MTEQQYKIIKGDEVNSFLTAILRTLNEEQIETLRDSLTDRLPGVDYRKKYEKCISVIKRFDAGIIGMYEL